MATATVPQAAGGEPPRVIPPQRASVFADRARRFEALAAGHVLGDWLRFLGGVTRAQHEALQAFPALPANDGYSVERARRHGMPPLPAASWQRDPAWRGVLASLLDATVPHAPAAGRTALEGLRHEMPATLEFLADRVLRSELYDADAVVLPLVAAALQVYWTHMACDLGSAGIAPLDLHGVCPCCGFLPVASVVRSDGPVANLRYLHCALCNTEWNLVRVTCAVCDANDAVAYRRIADRIDDAVRAETCDTCHSYLKILYRAKDAEADAVADDLATLALDILMDEAGYARAGPNLLLVPGLG